MTSAGLIHLRGHVPLHITQVPQGKDGVFQCSEAHCLAVKACQAHSPKWPVYLTTAIVPNCWWVGMGWGNMAVISGVSSGSWARAWEVGLGCTGVWQIPGSATESTPALVAIWVVHGFGRGWKVGGTLLVRAAFPFLWTWWPAPVKQELFLYQPICLLITYT